MVEETARQRARRKFVFGVLEQAANILGAMTASIMVVGLVLPAIAALSGKAMIERAALIDAATLVLGFAALAATASVVLRGLARRLEDDQGIPRGRIADDAGPGSM